MDTAERVSGGESGQARAVLRDARIDGHRTDVVVEDGRIAGLTPHEAGPGVDLGGRPVLPGLWDNHVHFDQWALARSRLDLAPARSAAEAVALVAERLRETPSPRLIGFGFRDGLWPDRPDRALLDVVSPGTEIVLVAADLHCCWLNSAAARRYGHAEHPTGIIREADWHPIMEDVRRVPEAEGDALADAAARAAAARGVVGIVDFEAPFPLDGWARRIRGGTDVLRVVSSVWPGSLAEAVARGLPTGAAVPGTGGLLTMGPLKIVTDGSLNTRTAFCTDPYPGLHEHPYGMLLVPPEELRPLLETARAAGIEAAVHAIGDAANTLVLDAFAATGIRGRIEHAQLLAPGDAARFAELGIVASIQPEHALDDRDVADRYWAGRTDRAFPYRALLDAGVELVLGSDAPVSPLDPWRGIAAAVHRSGDDRAPWHPEQHLPREVALAGTFGPDGPLRPGRRADLVVLDADPADLDPAALRGLPVAATMLGGRWTHTAGLRSTLPL
ncbi:amidohydrolase family protein [Pseudonocardia ailaonensis]|uniref:Amidohydrolase family protein n=1 Tax=Pseudonocardia ailaonensis TaxID=367279 RepID=A0ABN2N8J6_9PSEU